MDPVTALAMANTAMQLVAYLIDQARASGATPEQIAAARQAALDRFDAAAAGVAASEPPPIVDEPSA